MRRAALLAVLGAVAAVVVVLVVGQAGAREDGRHVTPGTLRSAFAHARAGDVLRLGAGDYGEFKPGRKHGWVTLEGERGADARIDVVADGTSHVRFENLVVSEAFVTRSDHVAFVHNRFTGPVRIYTQTNDYANILFDGNTHRGINVCGTCYEGRITVRGFDNTAPNGVKIVNSLFTGGNTDGIQVNGGAYGTQIGPGNRFVAIHGSTAAHTDAVQLAGSHHTLITGNFFHDVATGIMAPDGADHEVIRGNVMALGDYPFAIMLGADVGSRVERNTLAPGDGCAYDSPCGIVRVSGGNPGRPSQGTVVRENVVGQVSIEEGSALAAEDHNLIATGGGSGPRDVKGRPAFAGGRNPTTWAGFRLEREARGGAVGACSTRRCTGEHAG